MDKQLVEVSIEGTEFSAELSELKSCELALVGGGMGDVTLS